MTDALQAVSVLALYRSSNDLLDDLRVAGWVEVVDELAGSHPGGGLEDTVTELWTGVGLVGAMVGGYIAVRIPSRRLPLYLARTASRTAMEIASLCVGWACAIIQLL